MTLSTTFKASIESQQSRAIDLSAANAVLSRALQFDFGDGAGANQANLLWHDTRTLAPSANEDLDLSGALVDIYGQSVVFARIKAVLVKSKDTNLNNVNVARPASNGIVLFLAASDGLVLKPGGLFLWVAPDAAGIAITAGTGDLLNIANAAGTNSIDYDVYVLGAAT